MMPTLNEYRELAQADAVQQTLASKSIYPTDAQGPFYVYGPLFPLLGASVAWMTGWSPLIACRVLSLYLTALTAALGAWVTYKSVRKATHASTAVVMGLVAFAWMLRTWSYGNYGAATPSALGCILLLATLVSLPLRLSWSRLILSALLSVACLFTKPYFFAIFGVGAVILAVRDMRLCAIYVGMVVTLLTITAIAVVKFCYPAFFVYNLLHHLHMGLGLHPGYLLNQFIDICTETWPLAIGFIFAIWHTGRNLLYNRYFLASLTLFAVWVVIGQHPGQYLTYAFNLWYIPLVIFICQMVVQSRWHNNITYLLIILLGLGCWSPGSDDYVFTPSHAAQQQLEAESVRFHSITAGEPVLNFSPVASVLASSITTVNNGMQCYTPSLAASPSDPGLIDILLPSMDEINATASSYGDSIDDLILSGHYPWIIADEYSPLPSSATSYGYCPVATFHINIYQTYPPVTLYHRTNSKYTTTTK